MLEKLPNVTVLELEGSTLQYEHTTMPRTLTAVSEACNKLTEVSLLLHRAFRVLVFPCP